MINSLTEYRVFKIYRYSFKRSYWRETGREYPFSDDQILWYFKRDYSFEDAVRNAIKFENDYDVMILEG